MSATADSDQEVDVAADVDDELTPATDRIERMQGQMVGRRRFMQATAATGAIVATGGVAAAQEEEEAFNPASEYAPPLRSNDTITFAEHDRTVADSPFYHVDDSGEEDDLSNYGANVAPREDADEDVEGPIPHNPISLAADQITADAYEVFPRGETKEDADGNEVDVSALQSEEWSLSSNVTGADKESAANGPGVEFSVPDGTTGPETATFSGFDPIDSGVARRRLFAVVNATHVQTGATVELRVIDASGRNKGVEITQGDSQVIQERIGDLASSGDDFGQIEQVEVNVSGGGATLHFVGLDIERESDVHFGKKEQYKTADENELETVEVTAPAGSFSVTDLSTMHDVFSKATIADLQVETQFHIEDLPSEYIDVEYDAEAAEPYSEDFVETLVVNVELPNPFDVKYNQPDLVDTVVLPSERYVSVRTASDDEKVTIAEIEDDETSYSWTDRSSRYDGTSMDSDVTVESELAVGQFNGIEFERRVRTSERDDLMSGSASVGGPVDTRGGGGFFGFIMSPIGAIVSALGIGALFKAASSRLGR